jgi:hypothetical protein
MKKIYLILWLSLSVSAQTGGTFQLENSSVAAGGGRNSGGNFTLDATAGQPAAGGLLQGSRFTVQNGFWTSNLAPTVAQVSIGGRVALSNGQGIRSALVMLTAPSGETRFATTSSFGYYRFETVAVGETYLLTVFSKRFVFSNPTLVVAVNDELDNLDFTAMEQ